LLAWTGESGWRTRIISTTPRQLFALVASGLFDAALYYRLNVMLLRAGG
jgi:DNA-binding NtrC family response regulator